MKIAIQDIFCLQLTVHYAAFYRLASPTTGALLPPLRWPDLAGPSHRAPRHSLGGSQTFLPLPGGIEPETRIISITLKIEQPLNIHTIALSSLKALRNKQGTACSALQVICIGTCSIKIEMTHQS